MEISYSNTRLKKLLSSPVLLNKQYPREAQIVIQRLSELLIAQSLENIPHTPPPKRHKLKGNYKDCWGICVKGGLRIIVKPIGQYDEEDLSSITEIEIVDIKDYH